MILMRYFGPTGAAYACAETAVRQFIATTQLPFLPTPMGKGVVSDAHKLCVAAARSRYVSDVISTHIILIGHTLVNYLYTCTLYMTNSMLHLCTVYLQVIV